jgi:hypothetical protein
VVIAQRPGFPALLTLVQLRATLVIFEVCAAIAILAGIAVGILLADTGSLRAVNGAALPALAGIVVVADVTHFDGVRRVTFGELAEPALALMATTDQITTLVIGFLVFALVEIQISATVAILLVGAAVCIRFANTGTLHPSNITALALCASLVCIADTSPSDRIRRIATAELAVSALALMASSGYIAGVIVGLERHAPVLIKVNSCIAVMA